jgi:hypothetical protein
LTLMNFTDCHPSVSTYIKRPTDWNSLENNLYSNSWSKYHAKE